MTRPVSLSLEELDTMARTVWGEARGEQYRGQVAVAQVILNRLDAGRFGSSIQEVCLAPKQFSCWNPGDPNRAKLKFITESDPSYQRARAICVLAAHGDLPDPTNGATHYFASSMATYPKWADAMRLTAPIGGHLFLREKV